MVTKKASIAPVAKKSTSKAKTAPAVKKAPGTAMTIWEQEMAEAAIDQGSKEQFSGGFKTISMKSGILSVDDNAVDDNELRVIVLSSVHENQRYDGPYNPNTPSSPTCYAFGDNEDEMSPHEAAPDKQADLCSSCWANEWGSADQGRGKACGNVRRLVCVTEDALESAEALGEAEARMMKIPVTSVKNWVNYMKNTLAEELHRPCYGVVTRIKVVPDAKSQFKVQFHFEELVDFSVDGLYDAMKKRAKAAREESTQAYPVFEEEAKPAAKGRKTIPIKPVAGKPGTKAAPAAKSARGGKY